MTDQLPTEPTGPKWKVIAQTPQLVQNATGQYVQGYRVTAQLPSTSTFHIDVPDALYTMDKVRELLGTKAAEVDAIDHLGT